MKPSLSWRPLTAAGIVALVAVGLWWGHWGQIIKVSPLKDREGFLDHGIPASLWMDADAVEFIGDWRLGRDGWIAGRAFEVRGTSPADAVDIQLRGRPAEMSLWCIRDLKSGESGETAAAAMSAASVGCDGKSRQKADGRYRRHRLEAGNGGGGFRAQLLYWDFPESSGPGEGLALERIAWVFIHRAANTIVPAGALAAALAAAILVAGWRENRRPWWVGALAGAAVCLCAWALGRPGQWACVLVVSGLWFFEAWRLHRFEENNGGIGGEPSASATSGGTEVDGKRPRRGLSTTLPKAIRCALVAVLLLGFQARWNAFEEQRRKPLDPDARGFLEIVESGAWYATAASTGPWVREPAWIWVARTGGWALGTTENTLRLMSLLAGLLVVAQTARLGSRWFGPAVGLAGATGVALAPQWLEWSARGLRTEWYALVVLTFVFEWEKARERRANGAGAARLGLLAAAAQLTYISSAAWTFPLLLVWALGGRRGATRFVAAAAISLLPLLPHLVFNYRFQDSRDPLFSSNIHARYYKNYEFQDKPGHLTREEFLRDPYAGPPVTTMKYLLGMHSPAELARGMARGGWNIFARRVAGIEQFGASKTLVAVYALGVLAALLGRGGGGRRSVGIWIWMSLPFLYLASLPGGMDTRLVAFLTPWMWLYLALGLETALGWIRGMTAHAGRGDCSPGNIPQPHSLPNNT